MLCFDCCLAGANLFSELALWFLPKGALSGSLPGLSIMVALGGFLTIRSFNITTPGHPKAGIEPGHGKRSRESGSVKSAMARRWPPKANWQLMQPASVSDGAG